VNDSPAARHRERLRVATSLFDRHALLRPAALPEARDARAKALREMPPAKLDCQLGEALAMWIARHADAKNLLLTLAAIEISEMPVAPSVLAQLLGGENEHDLAARVKLLEEHGLVRIADRSGWIASGRLLESTPSFALSIMGPEILQGLAETYYSCLAAAPEEDDDSTDYMQSLHALRLLALVRLFPRGDLLTRTPQLAMAFVELAILEGTAIATEAIPHAEDTLDLAIRLAEDGTVEVDSEGRVHLLRTKSLLYLRRGEFAEALHALETARPLAAALEAEVRMTIECALMATLVEMRSPRAGEQCLATLRLAREAGDRKTEELALTIRFQWLCEQGEELQLLEEHDAEALRVLPLEPSVERQVYTASAEAMHRDEDAGIAVLKSIIARARRTREQFILARALRRHAAVHAARGRRSKAAGLYRQAADAAYAGGLFSELRDVLAELARVLASIRSPVPAMEAVRAATESIELVREGSPNDRVLAVALLARISALSLLREWKPALLDCRALLQCAGRLCDARASFEAYIRASEAHAALGKAGQAAKCAVMALWVAREHRLEHLAALAMPTARRLIPGASEADVLAKVARIDRKMRAERLPPP
jgi:tetratricopeptide (TPR) repeat protein